LYALKYTKDLGFWGKSDEAVKLNCKICDSIARGWRFGKTRAGINYEFPDIPSKEKIRFLTKHYWNEGVKQGVNFTRELPCLTRLGVGKLSEIIKEKLQKRNEQPAIVKN
jgi:hypothetical protein